MLEEAHSLPDDIAALKAMVLSSRAELAARDAELRNRDLLIEKLKHQLAGLRRQRFGTASETLDQLELGLEDEEIARAAEAPPEPPAVAKKQPKRRPLPDHLPRDETVLAPGERCMGCGGRLKRLGEDVTEELEYIPGRFVVKRIVRPRLACGGCETFHQAPLPAAADRARAPWPRPSGACAGLEVLRSPAALPPVPHLRPRRRGARPLDAGRLGRQGDGAAGAAGRCDRAPCAGRASPVRRRHSDQAAGAGHRQDSDRPGLDLRPG